MELIGGRVLWRAGSVRWKHFNYLSKTINGNVYNSEDIMSIPTSLTRGLTTSVKEEAEMLVAA